jgi:ferredoxin
MYSIIQFSATGNTAYAANLLSRVLPDLRLCQALEETKGDQIPVEDHLIIFFPIHGFNAPRNVEQFCKGLPPGKGSRISFIAVGCSFSGINYSSSRLLKKIAQRKGYSVQLDEVLGMPSNFLMAYSKRTSLELISRSEHRITEIAALLESGSIQEKSIPVISTMVHFLGKVESIGARFFGLELHAHKSCTSCGICWSNCPAGNITQKKNHRPGFKFNCLMCMRCIYGCPEKAISPYLSRFIPLKQGYNLQELLKERRGSY